MNISTKQDVRTSHRLSATEAARPPPRRGDGGVRAARRSRAGAWTARPRTHRYDTGLRADPAVAAQASSRVLRGEGARGTDEVNGTFNSVFEELFKVPQTWSRKSQRKQLGGPNGIRTRVSALRGRSPGQCGRAVRGMLPSAVAAD